MFVLTDATPLLLAETVTVPLISALPCIGRIKITIDPITTPRELAQRYAKLRAKLLGRKPRQLSEKHLRLAGFTAAKYGELDHNVMETWNRNFPTWRYRRFSIFSRDARRAVDRLLNQPTLDSSQMDL